MDNLATWKNRLLEENKQLRSIIEDMQNTSRANKAMLENALKRKQEPNQKIYQNCNRLNVIANSQYKFIQELDTGDQSDSTEGSQDEIKIDSVRNNNRLKNNSRKADVVNSETQTDPKPASFVFSSQTNFAQPEEGKIKELENLLIKQEKEYTTKLEEARKMDDVEDAFQAFLDQLDLNENEERIIIDGESRVWKIIRCSRSIIEDEVLEEEEEETEDETQRSENQQRQQNQSQSLPSLQTASTMSSAITSPTPEVSSDDQSKTQDKSELLKEQSINRGRPSNPMHKIDSPKNNEKLEESKENMSKSPKSKPSDSKEGILIEDNVQDNDSDSQEVVSIIKDEIEGNILDTPKKPTQTKQDTEKPAVTAHYDIENEKSEKSEDSDTKDDKRFPTLSDDEQEEMDQASNQMQSQNMVDKAELDIKDLSTK